MSTTIDFDDLITPDTTTSPPSADNPALPVEPSEDTPADGSGSADSVENENPTSEFPRVITDVPYGETPPGHMTVAEFTAHITAIGVQSALDEGLNLRDALAKGSVKDQNVYQAVNAKREPLPHAVVRNDVTTADGETETQTKVYLPTEEATEAWFARASRPRGLAAIKSPEDVEARVLRAGKARASLLSLEKRLIKVSEDLEKKRTLVAKYNTLLPQVNKTWDDAIAAYDAFLATQEKDKEIPDNTDEDTDSNEDN